MENNADKLIEQYSEQFRTYCDLLLEWNAKFNLTAITDVEEIYVKHFRDSLLGESLVPENASVLDVGAGAGFPSLPIKIVRPDVKLTLLDSVSKKVTFLQAVIDSLKLENAAAVHARIEDLAKKASFDVVTSRAVAALPTLAEYCLPFVREGGVFIAYKSGDCDEELSRAENAIAILGGAKPELVRVQLDGQTERSIIVIKKIKATPAKYPRGKNLPRKTPLR